MTFVKGFGAPIGTWMRKELREQLLDLLSESHLKSQGLFNYEVVSEYVSAHFSRREDHTDQLLALLVFQLWYEAYLN